MKKLIASAAFLTFLATAPAYALDGSDPDSSIRTDRQEFRVAQSAGVMTPVRAGRDWIATSIHSDPFFAPSARATTDSVVESLTRESLSQ